MNIFSSLIRLKKALVASLAVHLLFVWAASSFSFFQRKVIYNAPLFVDIVKQPSLPKAEKKTKKKKVVYKKTKKKKAKKKVKKKVKKKAKKVVKKKQEKPQPAKKKISSVLPRGKVSVEAAKFPFTYYLNIIQDRVSDNWNPWQEVKEGKEVIVYFRIFENGDIAHSRIEKSSGSKLLDQSALRAVAITSPLPPLPQGFEENYLGVHFGFTVGENQTTEFTEKKEKN